MIADTLRFMFPGIRIAEPGVGDCALIARDGIVEIMQWRRPEPQPTEAEITAAELPAAKAHAIAANRAECQRRIYARYPAGRQSSVALGIYSGPEAEAQAQTMKDWISDMVAAENASADAIEAATTVQQVEAVTVAWPV